MMTTLEANTKYVNLINHFKMFPPKDGEYFEVHHIVPRAIAPELINDKTNLVKLPYHAHVLAHLYYAYSLEDGDKHKYGQIYAVMRMLALQNKQQYISEEFILEHAEELDAARAKFKELASEFGKTRVGEKNPMFGKNAYAGKTEEEMTIIRKKISEACKGRNPFAGKTEEEMAIIKQKQSKAMKGKHKGKKRSDDFKKKISEANKGKKLSDDTKKKISEALKGKNNFADKTEEEMAIIKQKISTSLKGKKLSDDTKRKISEVKKGKHWYHNPETNESNQFFECPEGWLPGMK